MPATYPVEDALNHLRPMLDDYRDGHMSMDEITNWLANYEAELADRSRRPRSSHP